MTATKTTRSRVTPLAVTTGGMPLRHSQRRTGTKTRNSRIASVTGIRKLRAWAMAAPKRMMKIPITAHEWEDRWAFASPRDGNM